MVLKKMRIQKLWSGKNLFTKIGKFLSISSFFVVLLGISILLNQISVLAAPIVTLVTPSSGPTSGGTTITLTGSGFDRVGEVWGNQTTGLQNNISYTTATDSVGDVYMAGSFQDTITFSGVTTFTSLGGTDSWIAKYSSTGTFLWARRGGGTGADIGRGLATDSSGNVYFVGSFAGSVSFGSLNTTSNGNTDSFIVKYNSSGTEQWLKRGGGTGADIGFDVDVDNSGNILLTGSFSGTATFGAFSVSSSGNTDAFLAKYNNAGAEIWLRKGGSSGADLSNGVSSDGSGNIYIAGTFANTITFGALSAASTGSNDIFVVKYNSAGTEQWIYRPTGTGNDNGNDVDVDTLGNVLVSGMYTNTLVVGSTTLPNGGNTDAFVFKLNTSGSPQWAKQGVSSGADVGNAVVTDSQNNVYISGSYANNATFGSFSLANSGSSDAFIVGYNSSGLEIWAKRAIGTAADIGNGLAVDNFSNLYATGQYLSTTLTFGTVVTLTNGVSNNPYLVKYSLTPDITIDGNQCTNVIYISATVLTCVTPIGSSGAKNVVVTNPDGTVFTLVGGFTYGGQIAFLIRNSSDTANTNTCDLGTPDPTILSTCNYRLKVSTDSTSGYTVFMQTSGGLTNGAYTLNDAAIGTGGSGGNNIGLGTIGTENYGILISSGSITGSGTISRENIFNAGGVNSVNTNYTSNTSMIQSTGPNSPAATDTTNTSLITHNLNVAPDSVAGDYTQTITYTVVATF